MSFELACFCKPVQASASQCRFFLKIFLKNFLKIFFEKLFEKFFEKFLKIFFEIFFEKIIKKEKNFCQFFKFWPLLDFR